MAKLDKAIVLYYRPEDIGSTEGAHCGICMMYSKHHCTVVKGYIDGDYGVCGLYVNGHHMGPMMQGETPKFVVGYTEEGPTQCGNCRNYLGDDTKGECAVVEGSVEFDGCCNSWSGE